MTATDAMSNEMNGLSCASECAKLFGPDALSCCLSTVKWKTHTFELDARRRRLDGMHKWAP